MNDKNKLALLIAVSMLMFFSIFFTDQLGNYSKMVDYNNIWTCISQGYFPDSGSGIYSCEHYPPALIQIGKVFFNQEVFFKQFLLIIFTLITPLALYKITKEPITVWFYFSTSGYIWGLITGSFFAQALSITLILSMYFLKDWQRIFTLLFLIFVHSTSFLFGLVFFLLLLIEENFFKNKNFNGLSKFSLACSPFWGKLGPPGILTNKIANESNLTGFVTINTILSILFKRTPLPFLYFSVKKLLQEKSIALLGFMFISFAAGFVLHERGFWFASLPMIIGLSWYYRDTSKKMKIAILILSLIYFIFFLQQTLSQGLLCSA